MFWEVIIGNELVRPFKVTDGVKATAELSINFIKGALYLNLGTGDCNISLEDKRK